MGDGETLVVLGSTQWRSWFRGGIRSQEGRVESGGERRWVRREREREREIDGTGNKRMVLKSWRRAALSTGAS